MLIVDYFGIKYCSVTDLIPCAIRCGVPFLAVKCKTSHLSHFLQNGPLVLDCTLLQDAECNASSQSRHTGETRSGITLIYNIFSFLASLAFLISLSPTLFPKPTTYIIILRTLR